MSAALVVGLGHPDRGDDAIGWWVAREVERRRPDLCVRTLLDPLPLLDLLPAHDAVVLVDAALMPDEPGSLRVVDATAHLPDVAGRCASSHGVSLGMVLDLGRASGPMPQRLTVVAVGAGRFTLGEPPQARVAAAVGPAVDAVLRTLDGECGSAG